MLVHSLRCIFVHVPRTAGQSIEARLGTASDAAASPADHLLRPNPSPRLGPPRLAHLTLCEYERLGYVSAEQRATYFTFAFVRNPWDRVVSEYLFHHRGSRTFGEFLFDHWPESTDDDHARGIDYHRHVMPQSRFVTDASGTVAVDFVGRFEHLDRDFAHVCERLGLPSERLPHKNSWRRRSDRWLPWRRRRAERPYASYFDDAARRRVADLYAEDIERFGYRFPG